MQSMFGASVSELYLLIKSLIINIGKAVDLCDHKKKNTQHTQELWVRPGYVYKHAAHRLVQHTLQVVEVALTDDSTLAIFFLHALPVALLW